MKNKTQFENDLLPPACAFQMWPAEFITPRSQDPVWVWAFPNVCLDSFPETEATAQLSLIQESACEVVLTLNMLGIAAV